MMTVGGVAYFCMLAASVLVTVLLYLWIRHADEKQQNIILVTVAAIGTVGIFCMHATHTFTAWEFDNLAIQMLQVCNFNFILLPLCLIKKCELARQYMIFSAIAAASALVAYPGDIEASMWYELRTLNYWTDHLIVTMFPVLLYATGRFKPRREYVGKVLVALFCYFLIAFVGNYLLNGCSFDGHHNHSYTMRSGSVMILKPLYALIPVPFVYLLPLAPFVYLLFWLLARLFRRHQVTDNFGF